MDKRLSRTDLAFVLGFLFMLIVAVGAFFYGVKIGAEQAEARYAEQEETPVPMAESANAYQQQDLVSFYHTVFLPYREFLTDWLATRDRWLSDETVDRAASLKELAKSANRKYDDVKTVYVRPVSPLLKEAQDSYLKSLKLFADSFSGLAGSANEGTAAVLLDNLENEAFYAEAVKQGLAGQRAYYESMFKWGASVNVSFPSSYATPAVLLLDEWKKLPLLIKNKVIADYLANKNLLDAYLPQDVTARIDSLIRSGQAEKMKQSSIGSMVDLLTDTESIRNGDFLRLKSRQYPDEQLPQLPFFSSAQ